MFTLLIIGIISASIGCIIFIFTEKNSFFHLFMGLAIMFGVLCIISALYYTYNIEEYAYISNITYISEPGVCETVKDVYEKDGKYYHDDSSLWIPFDKAHFVEVKIPGKIVSCEYKDGKKTYSICSVCEQEIKSNYCSCNKETTAKVLCPNCNKKIDSAFCPDCGWDTSSKTYCSKCGEQIIDIKAKYCSKCGKSIVKK